MAHSKGKLVVSLNNEEITINDVLVIDGLFKNLLSVPKLDALGYRVEFNDREALIFENNRLIDVGKRNDGLYVISFNRLQSKCSNTSFSISCSDKVNIWHKRYGHLNFNSLKHLVEKDMVSGLNLKLCDFKMSDLEKYEPWILRKETILPFKQQNYNRTNRPLQIVHVDLIVVNQMSRDGENYILSIIDDNTSFRAIYRMRYKSDTLSYFKEFLNFAYTYSDYKINSVRCDRGEEFTSSQFREYCQSNEILIQYVEPFTPQFNSCIERSNRCIIEKARSILLEPQFGVKF